MTKRATAKPALRAYRIENELPADRVAKRLGISASTLRSLENGHREIDGDMAVLIEQKLGIDRATLRPDLFKREAARA